MGDNRDDHDYPDPDDVPRFAWVGARTLTASFEESDDYMNGSDMVMPERFAPEDSQNGMSFFDPDQQTDPNGEIIDPVLQYQDDSDKYN